MYQRILVPVDGSATSTLGLQEAIRIAKDQRARLRLISVVDEFVVAQNFEGYVNAGDLIDTLRDAGKKAIANALAMARKHAVKADTALYESVGNDVAEVINREAKKWKADLIVMGTHGRSGFNRMIFGSAAEEILRTTTVSVLIVRSGVRKKTAAKK
jgi:nucleotide-binding universal stress UspA family protein